MKDKSFDFSSKLKNPIPMSLDRGTYLMEVRYFYDAIEKSLLAEKELQETIAVLHKYQL